MHRHDSTGLGRVGSAFGGTSTAHRRDTPRSHYVGRIGCLALSTAEGDWTDRSAATLDALSISYERIAPRDLPARFPVLRTEDARFGLYDAGGGVLYADRIMGSTLRPGWPRTRLRCMATRR